MKFTLEFEHKDLARAERLNKILELLPRYHTDRRWNAKIVNRLLHMAQFVSPGSRFLGCPVFESSINRSGRRIGLRFLMPSGAPRAVYIHFHGGAWVIGNARLDDRLTSRLAQECQLLVIAVDFHNAVDDRLDVTLDDCEAALEWVYQNLPALGVEQIVLGGESSGAQLAAQVLLRLRDKNLETRVSGFVSMCGAFDLLGSRSLKLASGRSLIVSAPSAYRNIERLRPSLAQHEADGPLYARLNGLPPALFIAGELDPIVDDSVEMYRRWQRANDNATLTVVPAAPHGFHRLPTSVARATNKFARRWVLQTLGAEPRPH
jgi:acetyl esterase/lipase